MIPYVYCINFLFKIYILVKYEKFTTERMCPEVIGISIIKYLLLEYKIYLINMILKYGELVLFYRW